jgi:hypothetical protein
LERLVALIAAVIETIRIGRLELSLVPRPWPFAEARRADIARHFDQLKQVGPALWNGRVLLLHDHIIEGDVFRRMYFETDYASFVAWRDWGFPDATVRHCFALGALRASDGGFLVGVMNSHTLNAGLYQTAETLTHLRHRPRPSNAPISHWTTVRFCNGCPSDGVRIMSQGLRVLVLYGPSTLPNELNTTLTPHSIIHGDACFAFNKIWGIPGRKPA